MTNLEIYVQIFGEKPIILSELKKQHIKLTIEYLKSKTKTAAALKISYPTLQKYLTR